jgi:predicted transcriptional regulator
MRESEAVELKRSLADLKDRLRRIHMVKAYGRGMPLILKNEPTVKFQEIAKIFITSFDRPSFVEEAEGTVEKAPQVIEAQSGARSGAQSHQILKTLQESASSINEVVAALQLRSKTGSLKRSFGDLLAEQFIEYTIPDKPNSRLQKYRLTQKGRDIIAKLAKEAGADEK